MSYAAVISLKHTINSLSNPPPFSSDPQILTLAFDRTKSLQQLLERRNDSSKCSSRSLDALEGQIRDFSNKLEDALEFHESNPQIDFALDEELRQEIHSFAEAAKKMEKDYLRELSREEEDGDDDAAINAPSLYIDSGVEMIGRSHEFATTRDFLLRRMRPDDLFFFFSFSGEVGSGRTMMAKAVFDATKHNFDCCAWATVGSKPNLKEVLMTIIAQVDNSAADGHELPISREDEELRDYLYSTLVNRRYMIVLDDVGELQELDYVGRSLPDQSNGSALIFTTSSMELAQVADHSHTSRVHSRDFDELVSFSLHLLICGSAEIDHYATVSPGLKEAGEKIFENCRGNSVALAKTLFFLMKSEKTVEQWMKIAADKENPVFMVGDEISEINKIKREMQSSKWVVDEQVRNMCVEWISSWVDGSYYLDEIKTNMYPKRFFPRMQIICVLGMTGIGKSTFVRKIFDDESSWSYFDYHVWITLGQEYHTEDILIDVLAQIYPTIHKMHIKGDEKLAMELCAQLSSETKRCLIVLDDLCCDEPLYHLKNMLPDIMGTTFLTTRLAKVAKSGKCDYSIELKLMDEEQSWCLLRHKVFAEGSCPPELEKAGRQIAEKCDGLPLLILKVAEQLLKVEMSEEHWSNVATGKQKSVFVNAHSQISHMVLPTYLSLPQHLKACFLYLGVFHEKYEVFKSNLTNLWVAEGFLEPNSPKGITYSIDENSGSRVINIWSAEGLFELNSPKTIEDTVDECISELDDRSLVMIQRKVSDFQIKTCRLHAIFWHLSNNQAAKNKLFHAMNSYDDCSMESVKSQRRLCIRNSILLGIEDVRNSIASNTSAHSLLCVSPLHQYPVPIYFDLRLLRVLNALTIRLYEFPIEVVGLFHLRYLSLTCNGKLPTSISNLRKLQFLIVKRYMNIKLSEASSLLPVEIWDMKELKHLQVMGGSLPSHKRGDGLLNLSTLLDVSAQTCREDVLKWIPNLKRLGIRIELGPGDEGNSVHYLNNIHHLLKLESLKCVVVNPRIRLGDVTSFAPILHFPPNLKRLSLSGFGYPWKYMSVIGELKNLQVLKLKQYAFQGPKWDVDYTSQFKKLKFLLLEDTNLECWKVNSPMSLRLERLCIKHCYKLKELPSIVKLSEIRLVHIFDCNPLILSWAEQTKRKYTDILNIHLSWIEGTTKTHPPKP